MGGKLALGIGLFVGLFASGSKAAPILPPQVIVDENGHGIFVDSNGATSSLPLDNSVSGAPLVYKLPFLVTIGDVLLNEVSIDPTTGQTTRTPSDVIRFANHTDPTGGGNSWGQLIFYSDLESGEAPNLADVRLSGITIDPNNLQTFDEVGPEHGLNGRIYTPGLTGGVSAQPGFTDHFGTIEPAYGIISDSAPVPLPASAWAGLALMTGFGAWRVVRLRGHGSALGI